MFYPFWSKSEICWVDHYENISWNFECQILQLQDKNRSVLLQEKMVVPWVNKIHCQQKKLIARWFRSVFTIHFCEKNCSFDVFGWKEIPRWQKKLIARIFCCVFAMYFCKRKQSLAALCLAKRNFSFGKRHELQGDFAVYLCKKERYCVWLKRNSS